MHKAGSYNLDGQVSYTKFKHTDTKKFPKLEHTIHIYKCISYYTEPKFCIRS